MGFGIKDSDIEYNTLIHFDDYNRLSASFSFVVVPMTNLVPCTDSLNFAWKREREHVRQSVTPLPVRSEGESLFVLFQATHLRSRARIYAIFGLHLK